MSTMAAARRWRLSRRSSVCRGRRPSRSRASARSSSSRRRQSRSSSACQTRNPSPARPASILPVPSRVGEEEAYWSSSWRRARSSASAGIVRTTAYSTACAKSTKGSRRAMSTRGCSRTEKISSPSSWWARARTSTCSKVIAPSTRASLVSGSERSSRASRRRRAMSLPWARQLCLTQPMGEEWPWAACSWVASKLVRTEASRASTLLRIRHMATRSSHLVWDGLPAKTTLLARSSRCSRSSSSLVIPNTSSTESIEHQYDTTSP